MGNLCSSGNVDELTNQMPDDDSKRSAKLREQIAERRNQFEKNPKQRIMSKDRLKTAKNIGKN